MHILTSHKQLNLQQQYFNMSTAGISGELGRKALNDKHFNENTDLKPVLKPLCISLEKYSL